MATFKTDKATVSPAIDIVSEPTGHLSRLKIPYLYEDRITPKRAPVNLCLDARQKKNG